MTVSANEIAVKQLLAQATSHTRNIDLRANDDMTIGNDVSYSEAGSVYANVDGEIDSNARKLWRDAVSMLEASLDPQLFAAWIRPLVLSRCILKQDSDDVLALEIRLAAPNKFCADHVQKNYGPQLIRSLSEIADTDEVQLSFSVSKNNEKARSASKETSNGVTAAPAVEKKSDKRAATRKKRRAGSTINPDYTFDNFVVGTCNQFAHAVSSRVATELGGSYNPLFIYGGVGLGKTHLANAIANSARNSGKRVMLLSSESFVNELITALRSNKMQEFKERFRSLDLLIIDDIQFIIGKECTQEEFFHTFNALHQRNSQIVLTSDKIPQELTGLEERLRTRFSSGISVDVQAPDFETRVAILNKKADERDFSMSNQVAQFLAEKIDSNVRELEGALNRLQAVCSINDTVLSLDVAEEALRTVVPGKTREISIELIQKVVAERYGRSVKDLLGKRRTQNIALPRQVAMFLCRKLTTCSYPEIGALFGGRDHSTVIHAHRVITKRMGDDSDLLAEVEWLERKLKG